ncbi:MAG: TadE family protein [Candidatus Dormibacter sp.]
MNRRRASGQSLVEFAFVLPLMLLMVAGAYTMWTGLHSVIGLTSAARAGSLTAANQLAKMGKKPMAGTYAYSGADLNAVLSSAVAAVNAEEGVTTYQKAGPLCTATNGCVSISSTPIPAGTDPATGQQAYLAEVTISISQAIAPPVALISQYTVSAVANCPAPGA